MKFSSKFLLITTLFITQCFAKVNFDRVLLVINYNHAHMNQTRSFIQQLYGNCFKNIVVYGPEKTFCSVNKVHEPEVNYVDHFMGYRSYISLAMAMEKYPGYDGYLFLMDDCILNTFLFEEMDDLDLTKIWIPLCPFVHCNKQGTAINFKKGKDAAPGWEWWNSKWGYIPTMKAWAEIPDKYKKMVAQNYGKDCVVASFSDFIYIPAQYKNQWCELAKIFEKHDVFLEIAFPTIASCLSPKSEWVWINGTALTDNKWPRFIMENEDGPCYLNHPVKLSSPENRAFITGVFNCAKNLKKQLASKKKK
jgi:hypothetical protein